MTSEAKQRCVSLRTRYVWLDAEGNGRNHASQSGPTENQKAFIECGNCLWLQAPFSGLSPEQAGNRRLMYETFIASQWRLEQAHWEVQAFLRLACQTIAPNGNDADVLRQLFPKFAFQDPAVIRLEFDEIDDPVDAYDCLASGLMAWISVLLAYIVRCLEILEEHGLAHVLQSSRRNGSRTCRVRFGQVHRHENRDRRHRVTGKPRFIRQRQECHLFYSRLLPSGNRVPKPHAVKRLLETAPLFLRPSLRLVGGRAHCIDAAVDAVDASMTQLHTSCAVPGNKTCSKRYCCLQIGRFTVMGWLPDELPEDSPDDSESEEFGRSILEWLSAVTFFNVMAGIGLLLLLFGAFVPLEFAAQKWSLGIHGVFCIFWALTAKLLVDDDLERVLALTGLTAAVAVAVALLDPLGGIGRVYGIYTAFQPSILFQILYDVKDVLHAFYQ